MPFYENPTSFMAKALVGQPGTGLARWRDM